MYGRRYQKKRGFKRTLVLLLTLVMLASVCFPGLRASAEGDTADVTVHVGEKAERLVSGEIGNIVVVQENSGLVFEKAEGKIIVDATNAVPGTYTVVFGPENGIEQSFTVLVTSAVEPENLETDAEPASMVDDETDTADPSEEPATAPTEETTAATEETVTEPTEETTVATEETVTEPTEETIAVTEETVTEPTEETTIATEETVERADVMGAPNISTYASPASLTIEQGKSGNSTLSHDVSYGFMYSATNEGITATYSGNKVTISVGQNVPAGSYSVTVKYTYKAGWFGSATTSETIDVTVKEAGDDIRFASVFYLKSPTSDPRSNDTGNWGDPSVTDSARVNMKGANWEDTTSETNKNVFDNVESFILDWSDGSHGATWTLEKDKHYAVYEQVFGTYKAELETNLGIDDLTIDDIESITLIPVKISQNNGTTSTGQRDTHIDCRIDVKCSKAYVARFNVQYPGQGSYVAVSAENKKIRNDVPESIAKYDDSTQVPATREYNGITYVFDGWYNEAGIKVSDTAWPYKPSTEELNDGTVNFYARYVPATTSVTINKTVSGNMGDYNKSFAFTYKVGESGTQGSFNLSHRGSETLSNLSIGQTLYIMEDADTYDKVVSYSVDGSDSITVQADGNGWYAIPIAAGTTVSFTNTKNATIDTGVFTDTAPYILLFSIAAVGAAVLMKKRRCEY